LYIIYIKYESKELIFALNKVNRREAAAKVQHMSQGMDCSRTWRCIGDPWMQPKVLAERCFTTAGAPHAACAPPSATLAVLTTKTGIPSPPRQSRRSIRRWGAALGAPYGTLPPPPALNTGKYDTHNCFYGPSVGGERAVAI
jgi:hypothetical protein